MLMELTFGTVALVIFIIAMVFVFKTINVVPQQHAWVVERLGKFHAVLAPGLNIVVPFVDRIAYKHVLKEIPLDVPPQVCITRDNTQLQVDGILYFQVTDAMRASYGSSNYIQAITQLAQTTLRSVLGKHELDDMLAERERLNIDIQQVLDAQTDAWGIKVANVEIKHVDLDESMVRAIARQAEAERERRAKVIHAEGELQASEKLMQAAEVLARQGGSMQLRYLQTLSTIAGDKSSTIVFPLPVELLSRLMERDGGQARG